MGIGLILQLSSMALGATPPQPWEAWKDLEQLARLEPTAQTLLRSSYCLDGCRHDRSSEGDTRFIRTEGDEAIIFDAAGPGAITRIWMTSRIDGSHPVEIPPSVTLRLYLGDDATPTIDMPLHALFDSSTAPFLAPLVGDDTVSSGGFFSYVPISYSNGAKIALLNADTVKLWYQINHTQLPAGSEVRNFDPASDFSQFTDLLSTPASSPWTNTTRSESQLTLGANTTVYDSSGSGWIKELRFCGLAPSSLSEFEIEIRTDDTFFSVPMQDYFINIDGAALATQSVLTGTDKEGCLYSWFPMPYNEQATITVVNHGVDQEVTVEIGTDDRSPGPGYGRFYVTQTTSCPTAPPDDAVLLEVHGNGKWVGLASQLTSWQTANRSYLEGDERIHLDHSEDARLYGTGTEDIFNAGFYFIDGPFSLATHGAPHLARPQPDLDVVNAYRMMTTDFVSFRSRMQLRLENGPWGDTPLCQRSTSYLYLQPTPKVQEIEQFLTGDGTHQQHPEPTQCTSLTAYLGDEPPTLLEQSVCEVDRQLTFEFQPPRTDGLFLLRRFADVGSTTPPLHVAINGRSVGTFPIMVENSARRWASQDLVFQLGDAHTKTLVASIESTNGEAFSSGRWEIHAEFGDLFFGSTFESPP